MIRSAGKGRGVLDRGVPLSSGSLTQLSKHIQVRRAYYDACVGSLAPVRLGGEPPAMAHFHHLLLDGNGIPKLKDLADCLVNHLIDYCLSSRRTARAGQPAASPTVEFTRLHMEARRLLRAFETSGEGGEVLLYLIIEAILEAPQMVAKMELKTNPRVEYHGSDGIHMRYDTADDCLDVFFGEAKIKTDLAEALSDAFRSVAAFHDHEMASHEYGLVTSNFKYADEALKKAIEQYLDPFAPGTARINHVLLIGYSWDEYRRAIGQDFRAATESLRLEYANEAERITRLLSSNLQRCPYKQFRYHVFFLPFEDVHAFRTAFYAALE